MEMNELNTTLRNQAIAHGLCLQWQQQWNCNWDKKKMIQKFFEGLDFCLMYRYPSYEFIKKNFDKDLLRECNVLLDDKYSLLNAKECVLFGNSESTIRYNARNHGTIYIRDNSRAKIYASGKSFVIVHLLENANVSIEKIDNAKVVVITHSKDAVIIADKSVEIKEEYDWLKKRE